jgi:hypothetical protein
MKKRAKVEEQVFPPLAAVGVTFRDTGKSLVVEFGGQAYADMRKAAQAISQVFYGPPTTTADVFVEYLMMEDDVLTVRGALAEKVMDFIDSDFRNDPKREAIGDALEEELEKVGLLEKGALEAEMKRIGL